MFNYEKMKIEIEKNGIKQKFIADKANMTERNLSLILLGKRKCTVEEYAKLCVVLNVPFETYIETSKAS